LHATGNQILGNQIGSYGSGGSQGYGISLTNAFNTVIGTTDDPNIISGNTLTGVIATEAPGTTLRANSIGPALNGDPMGNGRTGIQVTDTTGFWIIGGNVVAHVYLSGIVVIGDSTTGVWMADNRIFDCALLGIDLGNEGHDSNDEGDGDTGPNGHQNFPVITSADAATGIVEATLNTDGPPGTDYTIYFFENAACGPAARAQGETFLGSTSVTMPPLGDARISIILPSMTSGHILSAIASRVSTRDTSEFSECFTITDSSIFADGFESNSTSAWTDTAGGAP